MKSKLEQVETTVMHGYWYRNWKFPFIHYQKPILIIHTKGVVYSWNGEVWFKMIEFKKFESFRD